MEHVIRPVGAGEWEKVRELRLAALQDPVAHLAFLETYEKAVAQPDSYWQERTDKAVQGVEVRQFVAEAPDGRWVGSVTAIVERAGAPASFVEAAEVDQVHVVGVFIRPETRGAGLAEELFRAALEWAWSLNEPRIEQVRLFVHERNTRAEALYRKVGFVTSGATAPVPGDASAKEIEMVVPRPSVS
ncbi:GNAT family N-acetyltransferase [Streptomyces sp. ISL-98]|uniref:GNAT family N-acetyltransferase n=1 Tax=Streptomyces sp. ISL-98 TaxID=2819192 RepID=UPI001BE93258|nr:GNAT family N-acetyltransferase [Streptomyces sp. ISL-98]MBT2510837.1 GNAT family N-acetyltransferase [Streptomyces sp. ISL-98]